jgi:hypothetical protein
MVSRVYHWLKRRQAVSHTGKGVNMRKQRIVFVAVVLALLPLPMFAGSAKFNAVPSPPQTVQGQSQGARAPNMFAYAVAFDPLSPATQFGVVDLGTGNFRRIGDLPPNSSQGIARGWDGKLYGVDADNNLIRIDPGNSKVHILGNTGITIPGPKGPILVDVLASLATGDLFLLDFANNLYSVNPGTGAATLIGNTGIPAIVSPLYSGSLAGDCTELFFTIWEVDEDLNTLIPPSLYRIDPHTAAATYIGPTLTFMPGSALVGGVLYGFTFDTRLIGFEEGPHVFGIDTSTGEATKISDLGVADLVGAVRFAGLRAGECKGE